MENPDEKKTYIMNRVSYGTAGFSGGGWGSGLDTFIGSGLFGNGNDDNQFSDNGDYTNGNNSSGDFGYDDQSGAGFSSDYGYDDGWGGSDVP